ncbi:MAG: hypothetical protein R2849_12965 [Thermomicrobiales bacterium]
MIPRPYEMRRWRTRRRSTELPFDLKLDRAGRGGYEQVTARSGYGFTTVTAFPGIPNSVDMVHHRSNAVVG